MTEERWDWRKLCAAVAKEQDQTKLLALMEELLAVLEESETPSFVERRENTRLDQSPKTGYESV
jgi:hypothetical protein